MAAKKKPTLTAHKKPRANTDQLLKESLVAALRRDAANEQKQTQILDVLCTEVQTIRALLERETGKFNLPAVKHKKGSR